jgi:hypothetical protein
MYSESPPLNAQAEREVAPIVARCQEEMARQAAAIQPAGDAEMLIKKFKVIEFSRTEEAP